MALKPVTDTSLLEQLNAGSPTMPAPAHVGALAQPSGFKPVTDPKVLHRLEQKPTPGEKATKVGSSKIMAGGRAIKKAFTGGDIEFPDAKRLADVRVGTGQAFKIGAAYVLTPNTHAIRDVALRTLPQATPEEDKDGNPMVRYRGELYYINKPGMTRTDWEQLVTQGAFYFPGAALAGRFTTVPRRMGMAALGGATTSAATDIAAGELGSEQGISPIQALIAGGGGAAFEGLAPFAIQAWRSITGANSMWNSATRTLSEAGDRAARAAGINPAKMTQKMREIFGQRSSRYDAPAVAVAEAEANRFGFDLTRGQQTRDPTQLAREELLRHKPEGQPLRDFDELQQKRMREAAGKVQEELVGGRTIDTEFEGGAAIEAGLEAEAQRLSRAIDDAWAATGTKGETQLTTRLTGMTTSIRAIFKDRRFFPDPELTPSTNKALREIGRITKLQSRAVKGQKGFKLLNIDRINIARDKIGHYIGMAKGRDKLGATLIKNQLDDFMANLEKAALRGDDDAIEAFLKSRKASKAYHDKFTPQDRQDVAGKAIERMMYEDATPEMVVNEIFGRVKLGQKLTTPLIAKRLKKIFGADSEQWRAVQELAWLRLVKNATKTRDKFSAQRYLTDLEDVLKNGKSTLDVIYEGNPEAIPLFEEFGNAVRKTIMDEWATNPSKSAYKVGNLVREFIGRIGTMLTFRGHYMGGATGFVLKRTPEFFGGLRAKTAVSPIPRQRPRAPGTTAVGTGAAASIGEEFQPR